MSHCKPLLSLWSILRRSYLFQHLNFASFQQYAQGCRPEISCWTEIPLVGSVAGKPDLGT